MTTVSQEDIRSKVLEHLGGTPFAPSSLQVLSGGTANFIYRAALKVPLEDGIQEVLIKHSEGFVATSPDFKISLSRCLIEEECLGALSKSPFIGKSGEGRFNFGVRTPKLYHFDRENNTQVQEYLPNSKDLKNYALKTYTANTPQSSKEELLQLGNSLGRWLRNFHEWSATQPALRETVAENKSMQDLKYRINFTWLLDRVKQFPSILGDAKDIFKDVKKIAAAELVDESQLHPIHGDFWTGNILIPDSAIREGVDIPVFVIDWEMAQLGVRSLDLGQMMAEMYELKLYKSIEAGLWMMQGFSKGYGTVTEATAFRTALHLGGHLVCFGTSVPGWGTPEQVEMVARTGKEIIVHAWRKDRAWFEAGDLACIFSGVE